MWRWGAVLVLAGACRTSMRPDGAADPDAPERWEETLGAVVTADGLVDYDLLEQRRESLDDFVVWLAEPDNWSGKMTKDWHARYLNAYNALVLYQVLERGRPSSVLDPRRLLPVAGSAFFLETQFKVGPDWLSLTEIEHERLRQKELDIRDHAALNCASRSCPPLRSELYRAAGKGMLRSQLDDQMMMWVMSDRGVRFDDDGSAVFNPIFDWYALDFEFWTAGKDLCATAASFATGKRKDRLQELAARGCPHRFFEYDWSLNDASSGLP